MDPERLEQLLGLVEKAREQGMSDREINSRLRRNRNVPFNSVFTLETAAEAEGLLGPGGEPIPEKEGGEERSKVADALRLLGQGFTMGGGDELAGVAAGLGGFISGDNPVEKLARASRNFQGAQQHAEENIQEARENTGLLGTAADVTGNLLPLLAGIPAAARAASRVPGAIRSGIRVLSRQGAKETAEQVGRRVPSIIKPGARGAAEGGLLGAAAGAGETALRQEGDLGERFEGAGQISLGTGLLGAAIGTAGRGIQAARARIRAPEESGQVLGRVFRDQGNVSGRASRTEDAIGRRKQQAREELIRPLEQQGREIPIEITETVLGNPVLRETARARAPRVVRSAEAAAAGERASSIPLSADEALSIHRGVRERASAFKRASGGDLAASVDPVDVQRAEEAFEELDDVMSETLEGFPEFQARWAREKATGRALLTGRKVVNRPADDVTSMWEGRTPADKSLKRDWPNGLPDDPQVRKAFREGLATELVADLEEGQAGVRSFIDRVKTGSQTREKLKIALGGEEPLENFVRAVTAEGRIMNRAKMTKELIKAGGFLTLGTSLFGGAAIDVLF